MICTVMLYQVDHSWHYSLSNDLCKELNELINYSGQARIVYEFDDNGTYIQTALLYDENGNDAKGITVLLTLTAGDELSSSPAVSYLLYKNDFFVSMVVDLKAMEDI